MSVDRRIVHSERSEDIFERILRHFRIRDELLMLLLSEASLCCFVRIRSRRIYWIDEILERLLEIRVHLSTVVAAVVVEATVVAVAVVVV